MKLRNKKTGEIIIPTDYTFATYDDGIRYGNHIYYSLAELNEEWEDYKPTEPLIKDEKIRKAVRAWADASEFEYLIYRFKSDEDYVSFMDGESELEIMFDSPNEMKGLKNDRNYSITELCGEE